MFFYKRQKTRVPGVCTKVKLFISIYMYSYFIYAKVQTCLSGKDTNILSKKFNVNKPRDHWFFIKIILLTYFFGQA